MDYRKTAKEILNHVGGSKNIVSAAHCATRLRLVIADNTKADKTALENVELALQICKDPLDAEMVLKEVGLADRMKNFPAQLSGGEQQNLLQSQASQPARKQKQKKLLPKSRTGL